MKILIISIKILVAVAGLAVLLSFGLIDLGVLTRVAEHPQLLALAFLCLVATIPLAAVRWWILLKGLDIKVGLRWSLNVTLISLYFHTFLPGAYGGDLVRLGMAYRATNAGLNRLTFSVVTDRLTGLAALLLLGIVMIPALPDVYANRLEWVAGIALAVGVIAIPLALASGDWVVKQIRRLPAPVGEKLAHIASEVLAALRAYVSQPATLSVAFLLSLVQYFLVLGALIMLGWAMQIEALSPSVYIIAGIWSLVANALPITPGGLGVGEAAFAHIAGSLADPSLAGEAFGTVFLAMRVLSIIIGAVGVLPFLMYRNDVQQGIVPTKNCVAANDGCPSEAK
jgi:uncharacterized protein (TIRG00374 family)